MHYRSQGEGIRCSNDFRRRDLVLNCSQEKGSGAQLFTGEGNWCITVNKDKETGALLLMFSEEGRNVTGLYCTQEKGSGAVPSLLVNSAESRQLVLVKFVKHFGFCFQQKIIGFIGFYLDKT